MSGMETLIRRPIHKNAHRCAFTGYRPAKLPFGYDEECPLALDFRKRLRETIEILILQGYRHSRFPYCKQEILPPPSRNTLANR